MSGFRLRSHTLDAYWDAIVRGDAHPDASGLPAEQAETVQWFQRLSAPVPDPNRDRAWDDVRQRIDNRSPKEIETMNATRALASPQVPTIDLPALTVTRRRAMTWLSILVLLGLIGSLGYGVFVGQHGNDRPLPAVQSTESGSPVGTPWPQFRGGSDRTGATSDPGPGSALENRWSFTVDGNLNGIVIDAGRVVLSGQEGEVYALDAATGTQLWGLDLSNGAYGTIGSYPVPAAGNDLVVIPAITGELLALDAASGELRWSHADADYGGVSPTISDGLLWAVQDGQMLIAFELDSGSLKHDLELPSILSIPPTITASGIYAVFDDGRVAGWDKSNGELLWLTEPLPVHRTATFFDGSLFIPGPNGEVTALDAATGSVMWQVDAGDGEAQALAVSEPGVIVPLPGTGLALLDRSTGAELWRLSADGLVNPAYLGGETVYVTLDGETLAALDLATGDQLAQAAVEFPGSNAAISGDLLVLSGQRGTVRAFGPAAGEPSIVRGGTPIPLELPAEPTEAVVEAAQASEGHIELELIASTEVPIPPGSAGVQTGPAGVLWYYREDGSIMVLDRDGNLLETRTYGAGDGDGEFAWFLDIYEPPQWIWVSTQAAFLDDGTVWITDAANARIQVLDASGSVIASIGERGEGDGQFLGPVWVTRTPAGELLVVDMWKGDLQWFDQDGTFLRRSTGPEDNPFVRPFQAMYDSQGNLWVADSRTATIYKYDANFELLFTIGGQDGATPGSQLPEPGQFAIDEHDRIWVAGQRPGRLDVFDSDGNLLGTYDGCASSAGCLRSAGFIASGGNGYIYVIDYDRNGAEPERLIKLRVTSMPEVPIMAAATPAAG